MALHIQKKKIADLKFLLQEVPALVINGPTHNVILIILLNKAWAMNMHSENCVQYNVHIWPDATIHSLPLSMYIITLIGRGGGIVLW